MCEHVKVVLRCVTHAILVGLRQMGLYVRGIGFNPEFCGTYHF